MIISEYIDTSLDCLMKKRLGEEISLKNMRYVVGEVVFTLFEEYFLFPKVSKVV